MKNNIIFLLFVFIFPAVAGGGSWHMQTQGVILRHTDKVYFSPPLVAGMAVTQNGDLSSVSWQYQPNDATTPNLVAHLCQNNKCISLLGRSGTTYAFKGRNAGEPFYFTYEIKQPGHLQKPIYIMANSITANYVITTGSE